MVKPLNRKGPNIDSFQNNDDEDVNDEREIGIKTTERNPMEFGTIEETTNAPTAGGLSGMVTKVPQQDDGEGDGQQDLHKQHFVQTVQALQFIKNNIRVVDPEEIQDLIIDLPPPRNPKERK